MTSLRNIPTALLSEWMESAHTHAKSLLEERTRITNEINETRAVMGEINAEIQRRADVSWRNRQRLGLRPIPPMVSTNDPFTPPTPPNAPPAIAAIPVREEVREDGWVEIAPEPSPRRCFQCQFWKNRRGNNSPLGYCNRLSVSCAAGSMTCGHFILTTPTISALATDTLATPDTMEACDGRR
jgi:hypothetical protein